MSILFVFLDVSLKLDWVAFHQHEQLVEQTFQELHDIDLCWQLEIARPNLSFDQSATWYTDLKNGYQDRDLWNQHPQQTKVV